MTSGTTAPQQLFKRSYHSYERCFLGVISITFEELPLVIAYEIRYPYNKYRRCHICDNMIILDDWFRDQWVVITVPSQYLHLLKDFKIQ